MKQGILSKKDSQKNLWERKTRSKLKGQPPLNRQKFRVNSIMNSKNE